MESAVLKLVGAILNEVTKTVRSGDEQRIRDLHARLFGKPVAAAKRKGEDKQRSLNLNEVEHFVDFESREKLADHLENNYPTKHEIAEVARALKAPVTKADNYDTLLNKIIDATVGYRLRAETIRGRSKTVAES